MIIGVPKEIKTREYRVGMTPAGVRSLTSRGHKVLVERAAGEGSGISDALYVESGAQIVADGRRRLGRRHGGQGEGAARGRVRLLPRRASSSTRTCTWRPSAS